MQHLLFKPKTALYTLFAVTLVTFFSCSSRDDDPIPDTTLRDFNVTYYFEYNDGTGTEIIQGTDAEAISCYHYKNTENGGNGIVNSFEFDNGNGAFMAAINLDASGNPFVLGFDTDLDTSNVLIALETGNTIPEGGKSLSGSLTVSNLRYYPLTAPIGNWNGYASLRYDFNAVILLTNQDTPPSEQGTLSGYVIVEPVF